MSCFDTSFFLVTWVSWRYLSNQNRCRACPLSFEKSRRKKCTRIEWCWPAQPNPGLGDLLRTADVPIGSPAFLYNSRALEKGPRIWNKKWAVMLLGCPYMRVSNMHAVEVWSPLHRAPTSSLSVRCISAQTATIWILNDDQILVAFRAVIYGWVYRVKIVTITNHVTPTYCGDLSRYWCIDH